jgi:hypothetical protein
MPSVTVAPTLRPTSALTSVDIEAALIFFSDLTEDQFLADAAAVRAFRVALAASAGVDVSAIAVLRATEKASSQRRALRQTARFELAIVYVIQLQLRGTVGGGVVADVAEAVAAVLEKLTTAITSGAYATALAASLAAENATVDFGTLDSVATIAAVAAATVKIVIASPQPTLTPTPQPMAQPTLAPAAAPAAAPTLDPANPPAAAPTLAPTLAPAAAPQQPATPAPSGSVAAFFSMSAATATHPTTTKMIILATVFGGVLLF